MSQNLKTLIKETDMARFRVGNVRFGGGRKASIGFHGLGVGVTLGGGRKGGGGGGGSYEVIEIDWHSLTDAEKASTPLKQMRNLDLSLISAEDAALITFRRKRQNIRRVVLASCALIFTVSTLTIFSPFIFFCIGLASTVASVFFLNKLRLARKVESLDNPEDSQLLAWALVNDSGGLAPLSSGDKLLEKLETDYGKKAIAHVQKFAKKRVLKARKLSFREIVLSILAVNMLSALLLWLAIFVTNDDYALLCTRNEFGTYENASEYVNNETVIIGINFGCEDLYNRMNYFKISIGSVAVSSLFSLVLGLAAGKKRLLSDLPKSAAQMVSTKTKNVFQELKKSKEQTQNSKTEKKVKSMAARKELAEKLRKDLGKN